VWNLSHKKYRPCWIGPFPPPLSPCEDFLDSQVIKGYAVIASPLTVLLHRDCFQWNSNAQLAFERLKKAMTKAPVLALPEFTVPFVLETDASGLAMGVFSCNINLILLSLANLFVLDYSELLHMLGSFMRSPQLCASGANICWVTHLSF